LQTTEGKITIYAIRDITDRKRAESQIRELNLLLEQKVKERTAALTRSNDELAQFAYVASHDLKEPLRTVAIFAEVLQQEHSSSLNPQAKEGLTYILGGVRQMHALIDDLLAYSQVESKESNSEAVDMNTVLQDALFTLHGMIQDSGADVTCDTLPAVFGDRVQLIQLLQNLVGNSIKYRSKEPPRIHVSSMTETSEHVISVQDNGIGIDPRYSETVFKLFKRLHVREEYPGNGVGLAICRKIVERHGGRILVESSTGAGSTFRFTMPASR
jgi:light-regulated signal transduction histidine kinase (bacteriophytochrome)